MGVCLSGDYAETATRTITSIPSLLLCVNFGGHKVEETAPSARLALDHLKAHGFSPCIRRAEDTKKRVERARQGGRSGRVGVAIFGEDNNANGFIHFMGGVVLDAHALSDHVHDIQRLIEMLVELARVL